MKRFVDLLERLERIYLTVMVCSSILLSVVGVFYRYFLNSSLAFVEELAGYILAGVIVIGASMAVTAKEHIRVAIISKAFPKAERWFDALAWLAMLCVSLFMLVLTTRFVHKLLVTNQMSTSMEFLAVGWPLVVMPIGYLLCSVKSAWLLYAEVTGKGAAIACDPAAAATAVEPGASR